jgi:hypothetical protein
MAIRSASWSNPPSWSADVVLVSDEYKPESVGWRMEQQESQGPRKSSFRRCAPSGVIGLASDEPLAAIAAEQALAERCPPLERPTPGLPGAEGQIAVGGYSSKCRKSQFATAYRKVFEGLAAPAVSLL